MTLRASIGQLFLLGFQGDSDNNISQIRDDIRRKNAGGVILFDKFLAEGRAPHNISSPEQVRSLTAILQEEADGRLLITIDQEGGHVRRLKEEQGFPNLPAPQELARDRSLKTSRKYAARTAELLHELGINVNFTPPADINVNPDNPIIGKLGRSFSADPAIVTDHCRIWLEEQRKARIVGCLKHFPGHGSSTGDSHLRFIDISETWTEEELVPYRRLVHEKLVDIIMTGHLFNNRLDPNYPATLSTSTLTGLLRNQLGYEGLIITDDMQMQGIISRFGILDAIVMALTAGTDMILLGNNITCEPELFTEAVRHIERAVKQKHLSEARIHQAAARVQTLKNKLFGEKS